jgi:uncharacterized protein (DUF302 family)
MKYTISKKLSKGFDEAVQNLKEALQREGFGVITEVDLKEKFKDKLNVDFRRYSIFGACNPALAYEAVQLEPTIGVMLPCNVLVQENESGGVEISAINPLNSIGAIDNPMLDTLAKTVSEKLQKVVDEL